MKAKHRFFSRKQFLEKNSGLVAAIFFPGARTSEN
jgi:hypothetical protein